MVSVAACFCPVRHGRRTGKNSSSRDTMSRERSGGNHTDPRALPPKKLQRPQHHHDVIGLRKYVPTQEARNKRLSTAHQGARGAGWFPKAACFCPGRTTAPGLSMGSTRNERPPSVMWWVAWRTSLIFMGCFSLLAFTCFPVEKGGREPKHRRVSSP